MKYVNKREDHVQMATVNMWLDSGKLIPLYRFCFIYQTDILTTFQGKIGQVSGSQDDIGIWPWTTAEEQGDHKRVKLQELEKEGSMEITNEYLQELEQDLRWVVLKVL